MHSIFVVVCCSINLHCKKLGCITGIQGRQIYSVLVFIKLALYHLFYKYTHNCNVFCYDHEDLLHNCGNHHLLAKAST